MPPCSAVSGALGFDRIPDHGRNVCAAEIEHLPNTRGRGDIDLGKEATDHVDTREQEPARPEFRPKPRTDLALPVSELCLRGCSPDMKVGTGFPLRRKRD